MLLTAPEVVRDIMVSSKALEMTGYLSEFQVEASNMNMSNGDYVRIDQRFLGVWRCNADYFSYLWR